MCTNVQTTDVVCDHEINAASTDPKPMPTVAAVLPEPLGVCGISFSLGLTFIAIYQSLPALTRFDASRNQ